jgi:hypothetical protein
MYNNPYNQQNNIDRINAINNEIANLEMRRTQAMMPQPITQNFQMLNNNSMRYANDIEEVKRDYTINDTPFFSKDMSVLWVKNIKGDIKTYELKELVQKDEKDMLIDALMLQIEDLKKERDRNGQSDNKYVDKSTQNKKSSNGKSSSRVDEK